MSVETKIVARYIPPSEDQETPDQPLPGLEKQHLTKITVNLDQLEPLARMTDALVIPNKHINASLAERDGDRFGRPFGRDAHKFTRDHAEAHQFSHNGFLKGPIVPAAINQLSYQGLEDIPQWGIEKGKLFHEKGTVADGYPPQWFVDRDGIGKNSDARDTNPRALIAVDVILQHEPRFLSQVLPYVLPMLEWDIRDREKHGGLPTYTGAEFDPARSKTPDRKPTGLRNHRWTDNDFFVIDENGNIPKHPITAVEIAALTWAASQRWADRLEDIRPELSKKLREGAYFLKDFFNKKFVFNDSRGVYLADALDADLNQIKTVTCNTAIVLSSNYGNDCIIKDEDLVEQIIKRQFDDLFDLRGGLKTTSPHSLIHPQNEYHGYKTIWPQVQSDETHGLEVAARRVDAKYPSMAAGRRNKALAEAEATLRPLYYSGTALELINISDSGGYGDYLEYDSGGNVTGRACHVQAWSGSAARYSIDYLRSHGVSHVEVFENSNRLAA